MKCMVTTVILAHNFLHQKKEIATLSMQVLHEYMLQKCEQKSL